MLYLANRARAHSAETQRALHAADGYLYLGMPEEALQELDGVGKPEQAEPSVLLARVRVLLHLGKWAEAEALSGRLRETAYALAVEVAVADLHIWGEEIRFLARLRDALGLDKLVTAAIERSALARYHT